MREATTRTRGAYNYVAVVALALNSVLSVASGVAQQLAEPMHPAVITGTPVPPIETCYRVNFDKSGTAYSLGGSIDFGSSFRSDGGDCITNRISSLKPTFLYRYYPDPSSLSGQDKVDWQTACKSSCDWLDTVQKLTPATRTAWGAQNCGGLPVTACDIGYAQYLKGIHDLKTEHPLLHNSDYMDLSSTSCTRSKCNTPLKACRVRCEQNLPRQCHWQSGCKTIAEPKTQRNFCSPDVACEDRNYADEVGVEAFIYSFFGHNQWPSGQTDIVSCDDAIPQYPTEAWKNGNCVGLSPKACEDKYSITYTHVRGRCVTGSFALDQNCNLLTRDKARGCVNTLVTAVRWLPSSPISLVWDSSVSVREKASIVSFKLDDSSSDTWYKWFGSADTPLLVYDPQHSGRIESAHQLFGNWTFGGQRVAALALGMTRPAPWKNGYEAVETLDADGDGVIKGEELQPLGLWFDTNRDARSQAGEVLDIRAAGVVSLAVGPQKVDASTGDVFVEKGFERFIDGRLESGKTVDWFSEGAPTMQQLVLTGQMGLSPSQDFANSSNEAELELSSRHFLASRLPGMSDPRDTYAMDSKVTGVWLWGAKEELDFSSQQGVLAIREWKNGEIEVVTVGELGVGDSAGVTRALQKFFVMKGRVSKEANGVTKVTFSNPSKADSESTATLDEATGVLRGETTQKIADSKGTKSITYSWQARKALQRPE